MTSQSIVMMAAPKKKNTAVMAAAARKKKNTAMAAAAARKKKTATAAAAARKKKTAMAAAAARKKKNTAMAARKKKTAGPTRVSSNFGGGGKGGKRATGASQTVGGVIDSAGVAADYFTGEGLTNTKILIPLWALFVGHSIGLF